MKILLAILLTVGTITSNAFSSELTASEKLTSYLPVGEYSGQTDSNQPCLVSVSEVNYPKKDIQVRVVEGETDLTKLVEENSEYSYKDFKKEFLQTDRSLIGIEESNYVERIIRTVAAQDNKLYVVVSYSLIINRERETQTAECIIEF